MKIWQKIALATVFMGFFILRGNFLLSNLKELPIKLNSEQRAKEMTKANNVYAETLAKIKSAKCNVVDLRKGQITIHNIGILLTGYHQERDSVFVLSEKLITEYNKTSNHLLTMATTSTRCRVDGMPAQKGLIDGYDVKRVFLFFLWIFPINFLPFIMPLIFIKRWYYRRPWQISFGDMMVIILCHLAGTFAHLIYRPDNWLELGFNLRLEKFKAKYGAHGFGLVKAYAFAIILTILCLFKNSHAQTKTNQSIAVVQIFAIEEKPEIPIFHEVVAVIMSYFNNLLQKIKRKIILVIQKNIFLFVKQPLEFIWGLWARPPDVIAMWCIKANGFRAPAKEVICALNSRQQITLLQGAFYENQNAFSFPFGVHRLGFCPR